MNLNQILQPLKEITLEALFPRVCPVCGEILKLPPKWYRYKDFSYVHPDHEQYYEQILICPVCAGKLIYNSEPSCIICSKPLELEEERYCDLCQNNVRYFDHGHALLLQNEDAKKIIYDLKFHDRRINAEWIGYALAVRFHEQLLRWGADVLLPVPLHKKRMRQRGFNQAELIAEALSFWMQKLYHVPLPVDSNYLQRSRYTKPQRTVQASIRSENVNSAFSVISHTAKNYRAPVLIDDIFTSGSTLNSCAKTLKDSGSRHVFFLTASIV